MIPFHNAMSIADGGADDYTRFLAMIEAAHPLVGNLGDGIRNTGANWKRFTMPVSLANYFGTMWGSPWLGWCTYDSNNCRVIQHLFADLTALQSNNNKVVALFGGYNWGTAESYAVARNSYISFDYAEFTCDFQQMLKYYDPRYPGQYVEVNGYSASVTYKALP